MSKIRAIVKRTDEAVGHVTNISNTLKNLQKLVDGNIETVRITDSVILICNEEGVILDLPHNLTVADRPSTIPLSVTLWSSAWMGKSLRIVRWILEHGSGC